jgi:hypothetical protein
VVLKSIIFWDMTPYSPEDDAPYKRSFLFTVVGLRLFDKMAGGAQDAKCRESLGQNKKDEEERKQ